MAASVDPKMSFESFVVGPENRLAWEAARTSAETPGAAYNPLFIYSDTGLGKTHLLAAIANRASQLDASSKVLYAPLETLMQAGEENGDEKEYHEAEVLLIDDLQFLGSHTEKHQRLFHLLDHLLVAGRQVVLACDRPPLEMGELDDRLLSRFSGGLVVDIGRPDLDTRREILTRRARGVGVELKPEIIDAIARLALENVRQLQGALHRVLAVRKAEGREIQADEIDRVLADVIADPDMPWLGEEKEGDEFGEFLGTISGAVEEAIGGPGWRELLAHAILKWEAEGYSTARLERALDANEPVDAGPLIESYEADIAELESLAEQLRAIDPAALGGLPLKDPELIPRVRERLAETTGAGVRDDFFKDREKAIWRWPLIEDRLIESLDDGN